MEADFQSVTFILHTLRTNYKCRCLLSKKNELVVVCFLFLLDRALDVHDVRVDQLVGLQRVLRDGDEVSRAICQTVSRGRLALPAQHRGDGEVCCQR